MQDPFAERIYGIPWIALAGAAAVVALVYLFVPVAGESGARWLVLRWGHSVAWTFLSLAALSRSKVTSAPIEYAAPLGATGGLVYVALMLVTLTEKGAS